MNTLPSKELFQQVMNSNGIPYRINDNKLEYKIPETGDHGTYLINIYEFTNLCKKWAFKNEYMLSSNNLNECDVYPSDKDGWILNKEINFLENSELDAIIKACEWIIKKIR